MVDNTRTCAGITTLILALKAGKDFMPGTGNLIRRTKSAFEWIEHGDTLVRILAGLGGGAVVKGCLTVWTHMPSVWVTPIWLSVAAAIGWLLVWWQKRKSTNQQQSLQALAMPQHSPANSPAKFDTSTFFKMSYNSALQDELEGNIREMVLVNNPPDREAFFIKFISIGLIGYVYDQVWAYIFRSQLLLLQELNQKTAVPLATARAFYDAAANAHPEIYKGYSLAAWISFLQVNILLIHHASDMLEITLRGKDFLKYLTHWGRYPEHRRF